LTSNTTHKPPEDDLIDVESPGKAKIIALSCLSIFAGFQLIDLSSFVFNRFIATGMGVSVFDGEKLNVDIALIRISFNLVFYIITGYISYKIALVKKLWHPVAVAALMLLLWTQFSGDRTLPTWLSILGSITVLIGLLSGGILGMKLDRTYQKNHNKRMQSDAAKPRR